MRNILPFNITLNILCEVNILIEKIFKKSPLLKVLSISRKEKEVTFLPKEVFPFFLLILVFFFS